LIQKNLVASKLSQSGKLIEELQLIQFFMPSNPDSPSTTKIYQIIFRHLLSL
jgi:hypothetical protein